MKKINKKRGLGFVEVVLAMIVMSMLTMIIFNSSKLLLVADQNQNISEINMLSKSFMNKAKRNCQENDGDEITESYVMFEKENISIVYDCVLINDNLYQVNLQMTHKNKDRNYESYYYKN